jgi:hypothetical protein
MGVIAASSRIAQAGPWSIEPRLGLSTDYETNPLLLQTGGQSEEHVAAVIDLPLRYDADELEFLLRPSGRLTNSQGYSSLASNYEHLDTAVQYTDELDSASLQGEVARDSSLYFIGGLINKLGVPRDTVQTSGDWSRSITELSELQLDASWQRVRYIEPADFNELLNYRYWSAGPTWSVQVSERNTLKLLGSYGSYQALDEATSSTSDSIQLGFSRQMSEIWLLSTSAGYSRSINTQHTYFDYFGYLLPLTEKSNQDGTVYVAALTRQGERFNLNLAASRALQPTGFAFLSRQDSYNINATYTQSERWDFSASAAFLKALNPQVNAGQAQLNTREVTNRYLNTQVTANWHWTSQWTISLTATRITQQYGPPTVSAASSGIAVTFIRRFLRTQF